MTSIHSSAARRGGRAGLLLACLLACCALLPGVSRAATIDKSLAMPQNSLGLIGHWTFDGKDMVKNVADTSGSGNTGYLVTGDGSSGNYVGVTSTSSQVVPGVFGQALSFNGINQYVVAPYSTSLNLYNAFTISAWVKFNNPPPTTYNAGYNGILAYGIYTKYDPYYTLIDYYRGAYYPYCGNSNGNVSSQSVPLKLGTWYLITCTYNGSTLSSYWNGAALASASGISPYSINQPADTRLEIGTEQGDFFAGSIDDVRLYNRALSAAEAQELYQQGEGSHQNHDPVSSGLVGHWTFDSPSIRGATALDSSLSGNNGTLVSGPKVVSGAVGQALKFDGTSQYVTIPGSSTYDLTTGTVSIWIDPNAANAGNPIASRTASFTGSNRQFSPFALINMGNGTYELQVTAVDTSGNLIMGCRTNNAFPYSQWHFAAYTTASGSGTFALYVDGVLQGITCAAGSVANFFFGNAMLAGDTIQIGAKSDGSGQDDHFFGGVLDDARVYSRVLSPAEIEKLYQATQSAHLDTTFTPPNLAAGLVGHWTFDGPDMIKNIKDTSGYGNDGHLAGNGTPSYGATTTVPGAIGQAFDGAASNAGVVVPASASINNLGPLTATVWVQGLNSGTSYGVISKSDSGGDGWNLAISNGSTGWINFDLYGSGGTESSIFANGASDGKRHFIAVTWDGVFPNGTIKVYRDGVLQTTVTSGGSGTIGSDASVPLHIGCTQGAYWVPSSVSNCRGSIYLPFLDDVRLYNRALSATEVEQLYKLGE